MGRITSKNPRAQRSKSLLIYCIVSVKRIDHDYISLIYQPCPARQRGLGFPLVSHECDCESKDGRLLSRRDSEWGGGPGVQPLPVAPPPPPLPPLATNDVDYSPHHATRTTSRRGSGGRGRGRTNRAAPHRVHRRAGAVRRGAGLRPTERRRSHVERRGAGRELAGGSRLLSAPGTAGVPEPVHPSICCSACRGRDARRGIPRP